MRRLGLQLAVLSLVVALAAAAPAPLPLRAQVQATGPVIRLADLVLQPLAPDDLSGATPVVAAPDVGTRRVWTQAEAAAALEAAGLRPADYVIPKQIVLLRQSESLRRDQVWQAVSAWLAAHPVYPPAPDAESRMRYEALEVQEGSPVVEAMNGYWDPARGELQLTCRIPSEPTLVPFSVIVPLRSAGAGNLALQSAARPAWLVQPGHAVSMHLVTATYQMDGTGMPLKPGALGDRISVVNDLNHAVLQAVVTGPNEVRIVAEDAFHDHP